MCLAAIVDVWVWKISQEVFIKQMGNIFPKMLFCVVNYKDFTGKDIKIMIWFLFERTRQRFAFFSDARPYALVDSNQRVVGNRASIFRENMGSGLSSETFVATYQTTRHQNSDGCYVNHYVKQIHVTAYALVTSLYRKKSNLCYVFL